MTLRNGGDTNVELYDGRQCDTSGKSCVTLPARRLYAGASWSQVLPFDTPVEYEEKLGDTSAVRRF
jgi:hypothetical protein